MRKFLIFPSGPNATFAPLVALGEVAVFHVISRLRCKEADVHENGRYSFSLRVDGNAVWSIAHRSCSYRRPALAA